MTVSDEIRLLADQGLSVAEIARRLGIRYQHAYGVLKEKSRVERKPSLSVDRLVDSGFAFAGRWILANAGEIVLDRPVASAMGVYAFALDRVVMYVGVATTGLAGRLAFYAKPGGGQRTNLRLNGLIRTELATRPFLDIYTAMPGNLEWNG